MAKSTLKWIPIKRLDRTKWYFVLVTEDGAVRLRFWNPVKQRWELEDNRPAELMHEVSNPTHYANLDFKLPK